MTIGAFFNRTVLRVICTVCALTAFKVGVASAYSPLPQPPAICTFSNGLEVSGMDTKTADISLVSARDGSAGVVVLAFQESRRGLTLRDERSSDVSPVIEKLSAMIASSKTFTLTDVAASFDPEFYSSEVGYLSPDLLRCLAKES